MDTATVAVVIAVLMTVTLVSWALLIGWKAYVKTRHDQLRFRLFAARDSLTTMLATDVLRADSHPYRTLRDFINHSLRLTSEMSVHEYVEFLAASPTEFDQELSESIDVLDTATRDQFADLTIETLTIAMEIIRFNSRVVRLVEDSPGSMMDRVLGARVEDSKPVIAFRRLAGARSQLCPVT